MKNQRTNNVLENVGQAYTSYSMKTQMKTKGFRRFRAGLNQFKYEKRQENLCFLAGLGQA